MARSSESGVLAPLRGIVTLIRSETCKAFVTTGVTCGGRRTVGVSPPVTVQAKPPAGLRRPFAKGQGYLRRAGKNASAASEASNAAAATVAGWKRETVGETAAE